MGCQKCTTGPKVIAAAGSVIMNGEVPEIAIKFRHYLAEQSITAKVEGERALLFQVDDFSKFIQSLCDDDSFSKVERNAISLLFLQEGETLSAASLGCIKSLQQYYDLLQTVHLATLIEEGALTVHFQPVVDLDSKTLFGVEALARGFDRNGEIIMPNQMIDWANKGDMLFYLDRSCRENALKMAATHQLSSKLFINFIPTAIYDPEHCLRTTVNIAQQLDLNPKDIVFEVIRSEQVVDSEHLKRILGFYKKKGFSVALDDIDGSQSSLELMHYLRPDFIKIKRELIAHIDQDHHKQALLKTVTQIAAEQAITVIAKGVEHEKEAEYCRDLGVHLAQGNLYGLPSPTVDLAW